MHRPHSKKAVQHIFDDDKGQKHIQTQIFVEMQDGSINGDLSK